MYWFLGVFLYFFIGICIFIGVIRDSYLGLWIFFVLVVLFIIVGYFYFYLK